MKVAKATYLTKENIKKQKKADCEETAKRQPTRL